MGDTIKTLFVESAAEWREWLSINHNLEKELWLIYYKKHTGRSTIKYEEAVEEALCFGWIDSTIKRIDEDSYRQRFTPRKKGSKWSPSNMRRVRKLLDSNRMTEAGLERYRDTLTNPLLIIPETPPPDSVNPPTDLLKALKSKEMAFRNFMGFSPSYRSMAIRWLLSARRSETRIKRITEIVDFAARGEKLVWK